MRKTENIKDRIANALTESQVTDILAQLLGRTPEDITAKAPSIVRLITSAGPLTENEVARLLEMAVGPW